MVGGAGLGNRHCGRHDPCMVGVCIKFAQLGNCDKSVDSLMIWCVVVRLRQTII